MSHEKTEEDEKKDGPNCVFYPDIKCSVRHEIQSASLEKYMKPFEKGSDEQQVVTKLAGAFKEMFANEWAVLHAFCQICPLKFQEDQKLMKYPPLPPSPTPPLEVSKPPTPTLPVEKRKEEKPE